MTFSQEVKNEIANLKLNKEQNLIKSELLGFAISNATTISKNSVRLLSENIDIIERYKYIIKKLINIDVIESEIDNNSSEEKTLFEIYIDDKNEIDKVCKFIDLKVSELELILNDEEDKISFLRGLFLGSGYVCNPKSEYHLEIVLDDETYISFIKNILEEFEINSNYILRNKQFVVYIKDGESILNFIGMIGSSIGVVHFEEERVIKEMNNNLNRVINCEMANLNKTINASNEQIECINKLKSNGKYKLLNDKLKEVCDARIENPELSLIELANLLDISKSGLNNRLNKIKRISQNEGMQDE